MLDKPICYSVQLGVLTRENSQDVFFIANWTGLMNKITNDQTSAVS